MYTMNDEAVNKLVKAFRDIVRDAKVVIDNPEESHHRLEGIVEIAQKQLENIKAGKYRTKATQRMAKPRIGRLKL